MSIFTPGSQAKFLFQIIGSSLDAAVVRFHAHERISHVFVLTITLASMLEINSLADVVGQEAVLTILNESDLGVQSDDTNRYIHGIIRKFSQSGLEGEYYLYQAEVVPAFWRLSLRKNCRIFQETTTQEIIRTLLEEGGITSLQYRFALTHKDRPRGFCVQYRESDLSFITRLLQEEGIFYFFEHHPDKHVIVFGDDKVVPVPVKGEREIRFNENGGLVPAEESIHSFVHSERLTSNSFVYRNFSFKKPALDLTAHKKGEAKREFEVFDYPGPFVHPERGGYLAKVRLEGHTAQRVQAQGTCSIPRITPGYTFVLADHPVQELNDDYLIVAATHRGEQSQSLKELAADGFHYQNSFTVIPATVPFRPGCTARKPVIQGVQTAMVVGPPGEEIHTDCYGRVKVQFHWDREGGRNDKSSCWLRCAQGWGGGGWGMLFTPRVGDEVLVDFLEGDPDRPLIVGSVYNEANLPFYDLPLQKTISTIRTRSYPDGPGFNELRFEDRKGEEEIYLHGQKDWTIGIENDKNQSVGRDETLHVGKNREKHVGADQTVTIGANHSEAVGANKSISVGRNKALTVGINCMENVGLAKELTIGGLYQVTVGGAMNETVALAKTEEVGLAKGVLVGSHMTEKVAGNRSMQVGEDFTSTVTGTSTLKAKTIVFEADEEIVLRAGSATISLKKDGEIVISGTTVETKGSGDVVIKGARILEN